MKVVARTLLAILILLAPGRAEAACASPAGNAGDMFYNSTGKLFQYCNGTDWVRMHGRAGTGSGGCTNPARAEGVVIFNEDHRVMQGCAGNQWMAMGPVGGGPEWVQVSARSIHTCAIRSDGTAWCWGYGAEGQLGNGSTANSGTPVSVSGNYTWTAISTSGGGSHSCGIQADGTAWCWGRGDEGQLGNAGNADSNVPVAVSGGYTWKAIGAGETHTCGIRSDDTAWCWGYNGGNGYLGNGSATNTNTPVAVSGGHTWKSLSVGNQHTCAIRLTDDTAWCWGTGIHGQLGQGAASSSNVPVQVSGGSTWLSVSAGTFPSGVNFTCGTKTDGTAWCWGRGVENQLGNGGTSSSNVPVAVSGGMTWSAIESGRYHTCAVNASDDTVWCWGEGSAGQLGNAASLDSNIPVQASGSGSGAWTAISAGNARSCGLRPSGTVQCWGSALYGALGNVSTTQDNTPAPVAGGASWNSISAGGLHNCAIKNDDTAWCWGSGSYAKLGNGFASDSNAPVAVSGGSTWKQIAGGFNHSCGIKTDDTLWCWGRNSSSQLGNGNSIDQTSPVQESSASAWASVSAGGVNTCGIKTDGTAWCWGSGAFGTIGNGGTSGSNVPVAVSGGATWKAISVGSGFTVCGIKSDDTAWCWGSGGSGQLGDGGTAQQNSPVAVSGGASWLSVSAGNTHTCGIQTDGSAWCWGSGSNGQRGDGSTSGSQTTPVAVSGGGTWSAIAAGNGHSCGIKTDKSIWCWGDGTYGERGDGTTTTPQTTPVAVSGGGTWDAVVAGNDHACGLSSGNKAYCWGAGSAGQLGDAETGFVTSARQTWCSLPQRAPGAAVYNADFNMLQYCDGVSWVRFGK